jgi:hypothetical protein
VRSNIALHCIALCSSPFLLQSKKGDDKAIAIAIHAQAIVQREKRAQRKTFFSVLFTFQRAFYEFNREFPLGFEMMPDALFKAVLT